MTSEEIQKFYDNDKRKYILSNNDEFLVWQRLQMKAGYVPVLEIDEVQNLIDKIKTWYVVKTKDTSESNIESFLRVITPKELEVIECDKEDDIINEKAKIILRNKIIKLSALAILYCDEQTPDIMCCIAKIMIEDFNKKYNLEITSDFLDKKIYLATKKEEEERQFVGKAIIYKPNKKKNKLNK